MTYIGRLNVFVMFLAHYQGVLLGISGQFLGSPFACRREKVDFSAHYVVNVLYDNPTSPEEGTGALSTIVTFR